MRELTADVGVCGTEDWYRESETYMYIIYKKIIHNI